MIDQTHHFIVEAEIAHWEGLLLSGAFRAFHLGTCCTTWSRAPSVPYKTLGEIWAARLTGAMQNVGQTTIRTRLDGTCNAISMHNARPN